MILTLQKFIAPHTPFRFHLIKSAPVLIFNTHKQDVMRPAQFKKLRGAFHCVKAVKLVRKFLTFFRTCSYWVLILLLSGSICPPTTHFNVILCFGKILMFSGIILTFNPYILSIKVFISFLSPVNIPLKLR